MNLIEVYSQNLIDDITRKRRGETRIGEEVIVISDATHWDDELKKSDAQFVIIGIPEDIGVRANLGRGGAHTAWKPALDSFLNQQSNQFLDGKGCCVLGHIFVDDLMEKANQLNSKTEQAFLDLRQLVSELDNRVCLVISKIISAHKIPIIIGGGHNNAFPIIKACSEIVNKKINVINCDPHTDFRPQEGRHSGNGFSYAFYENYINKYSVCCVHEQYNTTDVLKTFQKNNSQLYYSTYEDVFVREQITYTQALNQTIGFVKNDLCGIEIDLDAITNVPSSAKTSSGLSPIQARQYVYQSAKQLNSLYFHIAEGAPILSHIKADNKTGKLIAYLMSDFIKGIIEKE
jgi:formiminoglutamase